MQRYGSRFDCRFGQPHDLTPLGETPAQRWERCQICSRTFRWNKGYKGRFDNVQYLKAHARQFAQDFGATKRLYMKLYKPEQATIFI